VLPWCFKGRLEKTTLGEIASAIREVYCDAGWFLDLHIDKEAIRQLFLSVTIEGYAARSVLVPCGDPVRLTVCMCACVRLLLATRHRRLQRSVASCIVSQLKPRVKPADVHIVSDDRLYLTPVFQGFSMASLMNVVVEGIPGVARAVIAQKDDSSGGGYHLLVEGSDLLKIMGTPGVNGRLCKSNHIIEIEQTLGIEAARVAVRCSLCLSLPGVHRVPCLVMEAFCWRTRRSFASF
jgi:DNA-directed RNA polymerase III subunit RPC1